MKRFVIVFVVLVSLLSAGLYWGLRQQALEQERPSGGSATIEGVEVGVTARLASRITAVHVQEGQQVQPGDKLVELDCTEPEAALADANALVRNAEIGVQLAEDGVELARVGKGTAKYQTRAARSKVRAGRDQIEVLRVQRALAEKELARQKKLLDSGSGTERALDMAKNTVDTLDKRESAVTSEVAAASATTNVVKQTEVSSSLQVEMALTKVESARQMLARARAGQKRAEALVAECTLGAPIGGIVQTRAYEPGEVVLPGTRVLTIIDTQVAHATFYLPNAELASAKPGGEVSVVADAYPDAAFTGTVQRVGVEAEFTPRNVQTRDDRDRLVYAVEVTVPNADGRLRPGMAVEVRILGTGGGQ